jgi:hypothetical protein
MGGMLSTMVNRLATGILLLATLAACGWSSADAVLSPDQRTWCRANSGAAVLEAAHELGYTREEFVLLLDDVQVNGWDRTEQDARYVRACLAAYGNR